jgi:VWFA-related protein
VESKKSQGRVTFGFPKITVFILFAFTWAVAAASGQDSSAIAGQEPQASTTARGSAARFLVHSDLVLVPVTVTMGNGQGVQGLAKEDFTVFDDRVPQVITHFTSEDAPASIGLVFDASDSMAPKMVKAREAVHAILRNANPDDEFFLIRFATHPELVVPLTTDAEQIRSAAQEIQVSGATAVLDALKMAWVEMARARHTRKAIILISDGEDNSSRTTPGEFKQLATENDTTIYTLYIGDRMGSQVQYWTKLTGAGLLEEIARQTGGHMFEVSKPKQLPAISAKIGCWIRSQYVLGYVPSAESRNGRYHKIQVKVTKPQGFPRLHSVWRLGYHSPNP